MAVAAGAVVFGIGMRAQSPATAASPAFEAVSIKPSHDAPGVMIRMMPGGRFEAQNITLKFLLEEAYGLKESQISGAPAWAGTEHYDIQAKPEDSSADEKLGPEERHARLLLMMQSMLADRFKLAVHHETKELPVYALVVGKNGPKFHEAAVKPDDPAPAEPPKPGGPMPRGGIWMKGRGDLTVNGASLDMFANVLSRQLGQLVVDKTGLKGNYDFTLKWTPDEGQGQMFKGAGEPPRDAAPPPDASGPSIFTALQEQLGLKLESQKGPADTIVIDHVERPSEN